MIFHLGPNVWPFLRWLWSEHLCCLATERMWRGATDWEYRRRNWALFDRIAARYECHECDGLAGIGPCFNR